MRRQVEYNYLGEHIGEFSAEVCLSCGETVFDEPVSGQIEQRVKQRGLYGLGTTTRIGVAGSSLVIRLTKRLAQFMKLKKASMSMCIPKAKAGS